MVLTSLREHVLRRVAESDSRNTGLQEPWNHSHHCHRVITGVIGSDCRPALDAGRTRHHLISGSRGRPRIRSPIWFRLISDVPPPIDITPRPTGSNPPSAPGP